MGQHSLESRISASLLRMRARSPFFGVLALFARFRSSTEVPTAATDGTDVMYNPDWLAGLSSAELDAVLLHEVLHAALLHGVRRGERESVRWNIAADVVVNGMIAQLPHVRLPPDAIREPSLESFPVEEVYALLSTKDIKVCPSCLLPARGEGTEAIKRLREVEAHWRQAIRQAEVVARAYHQGKLPAGVELLLAELSRPVVDWRTQLWRFLVRTPVDFSGYDRRFIGRKLYLEALEGESIQVHVCVDTSGSIGQTLLSSFMSEVHGILRAYPHLQASLYYADAELHGPFVLGADAERLPPPVGGGGTSFIPFFEAVSREGNAFGAERVCIYLTDGMGTFPATPPEAPVLWVVPAGGLRPEGFPFGEIVPLLELP